MRGEGQARYCNGAGHSPRKPEAITGVTPEYVKQQRAYSCTGNRVAASRDGRLTPEWSAAAGTLLESEISVMSFREANGDPLVVSIPGRGASSRWRLRLSDPQDPVLKRWEVVQ